MSMLKFVFAFCALILVSVSAIYAKDDKWIDGIQFRFGGTTTDISLKIDNYGADQENIDFQGTSGGQTWPISFTFPETLMSSWSFRGLYMDYQLLEKKDISLKETVSLKDWSYRPEKEWIYNKFFNSSDKGNAIISIFVREKGKSKKIHSLNFNVH